MKILLVGGGSGGHITPLSAVANQLKKQHPLSRVTVISERKGAFNHLLEGDLAGVDKIFYINAGKYRRYHGQSWLERLLDAKTIALNIRDIFKLMVGAIESLVLLLKIRPNVIFIKGGYVGVPVGLAARILRIPYITHDSDALPGLTNRLIAKKAKVNAIGMPKEHYPYPESKMVYVGVPVTSDFLEDSSAVRKQMRHDLGVERKDFLLLVTGGSNGALRLDKIVHGSLKELLEKYPNLNIVHQVGKNNEDLYSDYPVHLHARIRVATFLQPLSAYIAASDAVIARAGATAAVEIALQKKPLIIVPNPYLTGGHQVKNAKVYQEKNSAIVINESQALEDKKILYKALEKIINSPELSKSLAQNLYSMTEKNSATKIADLLINVARKKKVPS